jgi:N-acetylmuramic acid 6-phosphate etherase
MTDRITESDSPYRNLERMNTQEILENINREDHKVPQAVQNAIPQINVLVDAIVERMVSGGRLFYIGAGTSGRLGVVDASECPPTYGVPQGLVIGIIAGGMGAMFQAVEFAEDDFHQAWIDLEEYKITEKDAVVGIAASGTTPYVIGGITACRQAGIVTGCITCNLNSPLAAAAEFPVEVPVGPEFVTGSTRMKSGTAQKLVLNMISTTVMIQLGRVEDNKMVNMQLTNEKLVDRGVKMLMQKSGTADYDEAKKMLLHYGTVKQAMEALK